MYTLSEIVRRHLTPLSWEVCKHFSGTCLEGASDLCKTCAGKKQVYHYRIEQSMQALTDLGFSVHQVFIYRNNAEVFDLNDGIKIVTANRNWDITFAFKRKYPPEIFKWMPRSFRKCAEYDELIDKFISEDIWKIIYSYDYLVDARAIAFADATPSEWSLYEDNESVLMARALDAAFKYFNDRLLRWANMCNKQGYAAVWKLAGYFD